MTAPLPPQTSSTGICAECGGMSIATRWHPAARDCALCWVVRYVTPREVGEHLLRTCHTCGFMWAEACAAPRDAGSGEETT